VQSGAAGTVTAPATPPTAGTGQNGAQPAASGATQPGNANRANTSESFRGEGANSNPATPVTTTPRTEFQQLALESTGQVLPIFGENLFQNVPSTFAPVDNIPVSPDYVIGPGDEIRVQLFGQVNQQGSYVVDRTGNISYPDVGTLHVAGTKYSQLPGFLKQQLGRVYRNFDLTANLGQLRSIQIFVVGQARRPGSYTVSSLSTLLNALFASGGPLPQGSLRDIQLQRAGKTIVHFDLYDLLLHGDKTKDVVLEPADVIFIPPVGAQIALSGSVDNPAIYEVLPGTTATQAITLAGGETSVATGSQVRIERIWEHSMRSLADVDLTRYNPVVQNGDVIEVGEILGRYRNAVTLRGNVASPGRYVWKPDMRILDLVPNKEALITREYYNRINALGTTPLGFAPPGAQSLQIRGTGSTASSDAAVQSGSTSTSSSGGNSVGAALTNSNGTFPAATDVVLSAPDIDWSYAVIERLNQETLATSLIPFNPGQLYLHGDQSQNLPLLPGDIVTFFSTADIRVPTSQQTRFVRLEGEFAAPGVYSVQPGETLRHLLQRAGGFTPEAYLYGSEYTRESTRRVQQQRLNEYADTLQSQIAAAAAASGSQSISALDSAASAAATTQGYAVVARLRSIQPIGRIVLELKPDSRGLDAVPDLPLEDGDRFVVPRVPSTVAVEGQVYSANAFVYVRGRRERDYLKQAGGPDRNADKKRMFILRADGSVFSRQYGDVAKANMFPGDTIVVPPNFSTHSILRNVVDLSSVVSGLGFGIAAISLLANQ
jgi:protein involved in polysaccharide export with SLBB domain